MKSFTAKHEELRAEISNKLEKLISQRGVKSVHSDSIVLIVKDNEQFALNGSGHLAEVTSTLLIDNSGYSYVHGVLSLEDLCRVADNI